MRSPELLRLPESSGAASDGTSDFRFVEQASRWRIGHQRNHGKGTPWPSHAEDESEFLGGPGEDGNQVEASACRRSLGVTAASS